MAKECYIVDWECIYLEDVKPRRILNSSYMYATLQLNISEDGDKTALHLELKDGSLVKLLYCERTLDMFSRFPGECGCEYYGGA